MYVYWSGDRNVQNTAPSSDSISWGESLGAIVAQYPQRPLT
jgi:hypothetical protein